MKRNKHISIDYLARILDNYMWALMDFKIETTYQVELAPTYYIRSSPYLNIMPYR